MTHTIAIAGLGEAARRIHLPAFKKLKGVEVVGGCDPFPVSDAWPFPVFTSIEELLQATRPEIVAVAAPTQAHFPLVCSALEAGCHVLCEKPFMNDLTEARHVISLADERQRHVVVNNQYRFMKVHMAAKERIGAAGFGRLQFVSAHQTFHVSEATEAGWRGQDPRRTCLEFGIHVIDLCRYYFDEDPLSITARMPKGDAQGGPDYLNLIQLEFSGDRVAHITLDRLSRGPHRYLDMRLDGTEAVVETRLGGQIEFRLGVRGRTRRPYLGLDVSLGASARLCTGERSKKIASDGLDLFADATSRLTGYLLEAIDAGTTPPCHAEDNVRTLALVLAAYESHASGRAVLMDYAAGA
jgi:predicted dehydrogenase